MKGPPLPLSPITRRKDQPRWEDPESGYQRRTLTPPDVVQPMQLSEIWFPPRARMTFENAPGGRPVCQQIWMLSGEMRVRQGDKDKEHRLTAGDCLALTLDQAVHFHNAGSSAARYLVVTCDQLTSSRRKFSNCSGTPISAFRMWAIASCRSSRFLPVTRTLSPWIWA